MPASWTSFQSSAEHILATKRASIYRLQNTRFASSKTTSRMGIECLERVVPKYLKMFHWRHRANYPILVCLSYRHRVHHVLAVPRMIRMCWSADCTGRDPSAWTRWPSDASAIFEHSSHADSAYRRLFVSCVCMYVDWFIDVLDVKLLYCLDNLVFVKVIFVFDSFLELGISARI